MCPSMAACKWHVQKVREADLVTFIRHFSAPSTPVQGL
jgi:hypothetical protein